MVRATLAGQKTQTRRGVKAQSAECADVWADNGDGTWSSGWRVDGGNLATLETVRAPHGPVGRRLWVRETWRTEELQSGQDGVRFAADDVFAPIDNAEGAAEDWVIAHNNGARAAKWKPSIHMPRWASRITLEVTRVRVERVGDISEEDAKAEGVTVLPLQDAADPSAWWSADPANPATHGRTPVAAYRKLWDEIDGAGSFASNPWVWVYDFRRVG